MYHWFWRVYTGFKTHIGHSLCSVWLGYHSIFKQIRSKDELAYKSTNSDDIQHITSKLSDPIGIERALGLYEDLVVNADCSKYFASLKNISEYPNYSNKVKRVDILEK